MIFLIKDRSRMRNSLHSVSGVTLENLSVKIIISKKFLLFCWKLICGCRVFNNCKKLRQNRQKFEVFLYSFKPFFSEDYQYTFLLPCLQTIRVSDRDSRTVIGKTRHVTSPIWSRIDWLTGPKIRIVGFLFAELSSFRIFFTVVWEE